MGATSHAGRPAAGGATTSGRGQPSGGGTDRFHGAGGTFAAVGTGTVVHGDVACLEWDFGRPPPTRAATPAECSPARSGRQRLGYPVRWSSPDPVPMAPPHGARPMRPSVRARADGRRRGTACLGWVVDPHGRGAAVLDGRDGRPRLDPPASRRRGAGGSHAIRARRRPPMRPRSRSKRSSPSRSTRSCGSSAGWLPRTIARSSSG